MAKQTKLDKALHLADAINVKTMATDVLAVGTAHATLDVNHSAHFRALLVSLDASIKSGTCKLGKADDKGTQAIIGDSQCLAFITAIREQAEALTISHKTDPTDYKVLSDLLQTTRNNVIKGQVKNAMKVVAERKLAGSDNATEDTHYGSFLNTDGNVRHLSISLGTKKKAPSISLLAGGDDWTLEAYQIAVVDTLEGKEVSIQQFLSLFDSADLAKALGK